MAVHLTVAMTEREREGGRERGGPSYYIQRKETREKKNDGKGEGKVSILSYFSMIWLD